MSRERDKYFFHMSPQCCRKFPMDIDTIKIGLSIGYCMGHRQIFSKI